ncbi:DUF2225 domain-containing protein [Dethiothermospora halolimnae]|uniref:DUF2225 domain-containing protein n=1 Tax=Dethiothermospora halolimnae TaxID=3114390 RepID=UPI003CCB8291
MEELYEKKVDCPVCNEKFKTTKVKRSKLRVEKRDSDFFTHYKCENPVKYDVFVCPNCGYSALESKFEEVKPKDKELIKKEITSKWKKREFNGVRSVDDAIECYLIALCNCQILNSKKLDIGNVSLRTAWLYRMKEDIKEDRFLKIALDSYEEAYMKESLASTNMDQITLGYLVGELYRKLGDNDKAVSWFGNVVSDPLIKTKPNIEKMAREQWNNIRENK